MFFCPAEEKRKFLFLVFVMFLLRLSRQFWLGFVWGVCFILFALFLLFWQGAFVAKDGWFCRRGCFLSFFLGFLFILLGLFWVWLFFVLRWFQKCSEVSLGWLFFTLVGVRLVFLLGSAGRYQELFETFYGGIFLEISYFFGGANCFLCIPLGIGH